MSEITMTPKEHVEKMLKEYSQNKRIMQVNEEAIEQYLPVTKEEAIEIMNFSHPEVCVQNTNISDRVAKIAMSFRRMARAWNREALRDMMVAYQEAWTEVSFIDYAIKHLPEREHRIMLRFFVEEASWSEICNEFHLSTTMVGRYRRRAIERMIQTYDRIFKSFSSPVNADIEGI
jgi:DNA-directed RNA polymerase specialized sigma subunit